MCPDWQEFLSDSWTIASFSWIELHRKMSGFTTVYCVDDLNVSKLGHLDVQ